MLNKGVVATYPRYVRKMFGVRQGRVTDALAVVLNRGYHALLRRSFNAAHLTMNLIAPSAMHVAAPAIIGIPARNPVTMPPREAQRAYGLDAPADAHRDLRARQHERVFGRGEQPSDEGLVESQRHIGALSATGSPKAVGTFPRPDHHRARPGRSSGVEPAGPVGVRGRCARFGRSVRRLFIMALARGFSL